MGACRFSRFFFFPVFFALIAHFAFAQQPSPPVAQSPQRDSQALSVVSQSLSSMGASGIQDSVSTGTITLWDGTSGTITMKTRGVGVSRSDLSIGSNQITTVTNNGAGYVLQGGTKSNLPIWVAKYSRAQHIPQLSRMAEYAQPNTNVTYVGLETVAGASAHHIRISSLPTDDTPADLEDLISEFHVFVDASTMLPVKTLSFDLSPQAMQNREPIETYYSDYRQVGGILVPFHMTRYLKGQKQADIVFSSVQLNMGLAMSDFQ
jgi:hypothetical protein